MKLFRKINVFFFLFASSLSISQNAIVASGSSEITIGEIFPIMQTITKEKEVSLGVPKFEIPIEKPKPIVKKKVSFLQSIINFINQLFKNKKS